MAGEIGAGSLPLYGARLVSDMDACLNRIRNIYGVTDKDGNLLIASDLESLRRSIAAFVETLNAHTANLANPHRVTAAQVGADAYGTAKVLIDAHNGDSAAHPYIHQSIENMDSVCRDYISSHDASKDAHADIRKAVANAQSAADSVSAAAQTVAGALSTHAESTANPHGVTEEQVAAASGYDNPSNVFLRLYRQDGVDGKVVYDDKLSFYGQVSFPGASAYFNSMVVSNLSLFESGLMVAGGSIYIEDINNKDAFYALFVRDGKLYLDDAPLTRAQVRGLINE